MRDYQKHFIELAIESKVLCFGEFTLKSGRISPYFFNTGFFNTGGQLAALGRYYAQTIIDSKIAFDMVYGPAYKGIPLVSATAVALAEHHDREVPYCFNRKEAKYHGEGGTTVGAPLSGQILIIDDVISAGASVQESVAIIRSAGATPCGVVIALDREERGNGSSSAIQEIQTNYGIPVASIISLQDLIAYLSALGDRQDLVERIVSYRSQYGVATTT